MYEGFFKDRTVEDDIRDAEERAQRWKELPSNGGMRHGSLRVPVIGPPTSQVEIEDRLMAVIERGLHEEARATRLRRIERREAAARKKQRQMAAQLADQIIAQSGLAGEEAAWARSELIRMELEELQDAGWDWPEASLAA